MATAEEVLGIIQGLAKVVNDQQAAKSRSRFKHTTANRGSGIFR